MVMYAGTRGFTDTIPVDKMKAWEAGLIRFMETSYAEIKHEIAEKKAITPELEPRLKEAISQFNSGWQS
jgi:F-type H+-transporting ATPase subunit alpha